MAETSPKAAGWRTLGWAAYLACSWTWCIGMFLPVLLARDFGIWGFVVFGVPNVVGAAAMGWVLARPGASEAMVATHGAAMVWFTQATLGFHVFWLAWVIGSARAWIEAPAWALQVGPVVGLVVGSCAGLAAWGRPARWASVAAPLTLALSLAALGVVIGADGARIEPASGREAPEELLWLAPVVVFGFALCPYLDLTFHRARQALAPGQARVAFTVGFAGLFSAMIVLTLLYTGWLAGPVSGGARTSPPTVVVAAIGAHVVAQVAFTVLAHAAAGGGRMRRARWRQTLLAWTVVVGPAAAVVALAGGDGGWQIRGLSVGEAVYRGFMGLYGLAFPAYVWLLAIPTPDGHAGPRGPLGRRKMVVWGVAVALALPLFGLGFLTRESILLAPGLGIVLGARLIVRHLGGTRSGEASE